MWQSYSFSLVYITVHTGPWGQKSKFARKKWLLSKQNLMLNNNKLNFECKLVCFRSYLVKSKFSHRTREFILLLSQIELWYYMIYCKLHWSCSQILCARNFLVTMFLFISIYTMYIVFNTSSKKSWKIFLLLYAKCKFLNNKIFANYGIHYCAWCVCVDFFIYA